MSYQSLSRTNSLSSVNSQKSSSSEQTKSSKVFGIQRNDPFSRSGIEFTGPDGLRHQRVRVSSDTQFVGHGVRSTEQTGHLSYLFSATKQTPFPKAKNGRIGEIGWEAENFKPIRP